MVLYEHLFSKPTSPISVSSKINSLLTEPLLPSPADIGQECHQVLIMQLKLIGVLYLLVYLCLEALRIMGVHLVDKLQILSLMLLDQTCFLLIKLLEHLLLYFYHQVRFRSHIYFLHLFLDFDLLG